MLDLNIYVEDEAWETALPQASLLVQSTLDKAAESAPLSGPAALSIVLTNDTHIAELNSEFRGKDAPTNVLSFPAEDMPGDEETYLGDVILALETITREAEEQGKTLSHHLQHLLVHGFLHLLGLTHDEDADATAMEQLETDILAQLGIDDPYTLSN